MNAYFETSALIKLLVEEQGSETAAAIWDAADARLTSRLTFPEGCAALAAAFRAGRLSRSGHDAAKTGLARRMDQMLVVEVNVDIATSAGGLAETEALRGYDAVHLASALAVNDPDLALATWDVDLIRAAGDVGLTLATG